MDEAMKNARYVNERTIGQYPDGTWYWLDETWNYGNNVRYNTREDAAYAQMLYCRYVLDGEPLLDTENELGKVSL